MANKKIDPGDLVFDTARPGSESPQMFSGKNLVLVVFNIYLQL